MNGRGNSICERLWVRVNDALVLEAGACETVSGPHGHEDVIHPPATLFDQVLAYLESKPDHARLPSGSVVGREGVAAAALVMRWGSPRRARRSREAPLARSVLG